jgi:hypothetical protein
MVAQLMIHLRFFVRSLEIVGVREYRVVGDRAIMDCFSSLSFFFFWSLLIPSRIRVSFQNKSNEAGGLELGEMRGCGERPIPITLRCHFDRKRELWRLCPR